MGLAPRVVFPCDLFVAVLVMVAVEGVAVVAAGRGGRCWETTGVGDVRRRSRRRKRKRRRVAGGGG